MSKYKSGEIVRFTYRTHTGSGEHDPASDFKEVLVLHPHWQGRVHGIDLKRLTPAEREVIRAIFDPSQKGKRHRFPLVNDILRRMDPIQEIKNPMSFYSKFVKVFLRNKDAYRTYYPLRMLNPTIVEHSAVQGGVINPKPLFHKVEAKELAKPLDQQRQPDKPTEAKTPIDRMTMLKQRNQALGLAQPPTTTPTPAKPTEPGRMALLKQRQQEVQAKRSEQKGRVMKPKVKGPDRPK